ALVAAAPPFERAHESFYGLSGDAAIASRQAAKAEHSRLADAIYFVGDDSRSSAVAYLRGLAYPTIRWFDGARGLVLPPAGERGLYVLPDRAAADFARRCLGDGTIIARELDPPTGARVDLALAGPEDSPCGVSQHGLDVPFEGVARLLGFDAPGSAEPGQQIEVTLRWEALATRATRSRAFVRLVDRHGQIAGRQPGEAGGQVEAAVYPSASWRAGEVAIGTARLEIDPTLAPSEYFFELGFTMGGGLALVADDGALARRGQQVVRGGALRVVSRSTPLAPDGLPITLPASAQFGGVRLLGASLDGDTPRAGDPVLLTLFWQNAGGRLAEQEVSIVVRELSGNALRAWRGGPVDGTYPTTAWKPGEIVRDSHSLVLPASVPAGPLELVVGLAGPGQEPERYETLSQLNLRPITRQFTQPSIRTLEELRFGDLARLVGYELKDRRLKPGDSLELRLVWQALAETLEGYTVSVQLQASDGRTVARHDAAPSNGRRPTTGWLAGEFVEDEHRVQIPRQTERGRYRLAVAVYQPESREPLLGPNAGGQVVLGTEVVVE
nr:hypothetical protein [Chloroflexota bacterium]